MKCTKEEWKKLVLKYLKENSDKTVSIFEICSMYGLVPKNLKEAVTELTVEQKVDVVIDKNSKKWLKHKE